ncbi:MAG: VWA domain-containing protein [Pirellulaceae bacterium]
MKTVSALNFDRQVFHWAFMFPFAAAMWAGTMSTSIAEQNVVVVLDDSGSMDDGMRTDQGRVRKIDAAKQALSSVLSQLPEGTRVGVLALNTRQNGSNWIVPFGTGTPSEWNANIQRLRARGGTPLGHSLKDAADELLRLREKEIYGTYRLLIVTDGEASDRNILNRYLPDVLTRGFIVDVIGVDMDSEHSLATKVNSYRRADDDRSLTEAISNVFAETSADNQNAQEDFELLAALPDGFAEAAFESLATRGNRPIGEDAASGFAAIDGGVDTASSSAPRVATSSALGGLICCMFGLVSIVGLASIIFAAGRAMRK